MKLANLPGLRAEALSRLRTEGFKPMSNVEAAYIGYTIHRNLPTEEREEGMDHPLIQAVEFDNDILRLGKWDWIISWLSPYHAAAAMPLALAEIAMVLLGKKPIPTNVQERLQKQLRKQRV